MKDRKAASRRAADTMRRKFGANYYQEIGALGGKNGRAKGGFHGKPEFAKAMSLLATQKRRQNACKAEN